MKIGPSKISRLIGVNYVQKSVNNSIWSSVELKNYYESLHAKASARTPFSTLPYFTLEGTEAQAIPGPVPKLVGSSHRVAMSLVHKAALHFLWQVCPMASVLLSSFLVHCKD